LSKSDIAMFFYVEYIFSNMLDICWTFHNWYVSRSYKFFTYPAVRKWNLSVKTYRFKQNLYIYEHSILNSIKI